MQHNLASTHEQHCNNIQAQVQLHQSLARGACLRQSWHPCLSQSECQRLGQRCRCRPGSPLMHALHVNRASSSPADILLISGLLEHEQPAHLEEERHLLLQLLVFCLQGVLRVLNLQTGTTSPLSTGPPCASGQGDCVLQVQQAG